MFLDVARRSSLSFEVTFASSFSGDVLKNRRLLSRNAIPESRVFVQNAFSTILNLPIGELLNCGVLAVAAKALPDGRCLLDLRCALLVAFVPYDCSWDRGTTRSSWMKPTRRKSRTS